MCNNTEKESKKLVSVALMKKTRRKKNEENSEHKRERERERKNNFQMSKLAAAIVARESSLFSVVV